MNSMARIMKASQMSKVCASSHEYPHVEKIFVNKISKVRWPSRLSRQNNLKAKRKTTGQKETQRKTSQQTEKPQDIFYSFLFCQAKEKRIKNVFLFA